MKDFSYISGITNEKPRECGVWMFSLKGNKQDIVHHDGETMSVRPTLTQPNSHSLMLTDMLVDETPDIYLDYKNLLLVYPTEIFHGKGKKNGIYVSVYLRNTDTKFVCVGSGVLSLVYRENVDCAKLFTKAVSTERVAPFDEIPIQLPFPSTRSTTSPSRSTTQH